MSRSSPLTRYNKAESRSPFIPEMCAATKRANEREWEQDVECVQRATLTPRIKLQQVSLPALAGPVNTLYCPCKMYTLSRMIQSKNGISSTYLYPRETNVLHVCDSLCWFINGISQQLWAWMNGDISHLRLFG